MNITNVQVTGVGKAIDIDEGGALTVTLDKLTSTGSSTQGIDLGGGLTGSLTVNDNTSSISGATGAAFNLAGGGSLSVTFNGSMTQASNAALVSVAGGAGGHTGTITFQNGTLTATNGTGLQFDNADGTYNFNGTNTLSNTVGGVTADAGIDVLNGSNGNFTFSANTAISNPNTGADININGGTGNFTYNGTITDDVGQLVSVANKTGGTVDFNGAITDGDDGDGRGISLTGNTGATVRFDGGLTLSTGAQCGVRGDRRRHGRGDRSGRAAFNKITTTTGTALNIANTNIGSDGLTFQSISVNGAATGIILNNTGTAAGNGGLTVTGTGSAGTGGTIQNTGEGLVATSTKNLSLSWMNFTNPNSTEGTVNNVDNSTFNSGAKAGINLSSVSTVTLDQLNMNGGGGTGGVQTGINGQNVSNLTISNSTVTGFGDEAQEGNVKLWNLSGNSSVTNSTFSFVNGDASGGENLFEVRNNTGTLNLDITGSTFSNTRSSTSGSGGVAVTSVSNATVNLNAYNNDFLNLKTSGIEVFARDTSIMNVNITDGGTVGNGNVFDPQGGTGRAIGINAEDTAQIDFNINRNAKIYGSGGPIINVFGINDAQIEGRINNNTDIRGGGVGSVGSPINLHPEDSSNAIIEVIGNTITLSGSDPAIFARSLGDGGGPSTDDATLDVTIRNNNITLSGTALPATARSRSMFVPARTPATSPRPRPMSRTTPSR